MHLSTRSILPPVMNPADRISLPPSSLHNQQHLELTHNLTTFADPNTQHSAANPQYPHIKNHHSSVG